MVKHATQSAGVQSKELLKLEGLPGVVTLELDSEVCMPCFRQRDKMECNVVEEKTPQGRV